jgi:heme/copper-type cytochrome/quinol oxidase subunit 1
MTTIDTHAGAPAGSARPGPVAAVANWLTSSDHKKIGRLMVGESIVAAIAAAVIGTLIALERMGSGYSVFDGDAAPQLLALFRYLLVFGALAPLMIGLAVAVVPMQVGSRAIAFPRLAQFGFWAWDLGSVMVIISIIGNGGPGGGNSDLVDMYLLGVALAAAGLAAAATSVATTVLTSRAPGMGTDDVPAFSWGALVGSIAAVLTLPVAVGTVIYLYIDHTYAQAAFGGNKAVADHLHFSMTQPATFVFAAIAVAVLADIAPVTARTRQPLRAPMLAGVGLVAAGALGAVTQSQHMLSTDGSTGDTVRSAIPYLLFNGLPVLGVLVALATSLFVLKAGKPRVTAPFAFSFLGTGMVFVGMLGGMLQNIEAAGLSGTAFEEGATTYVVYGAAMALVGGLLHWAPKLWGVTVAEKKSLPLAGLALLGTVLSSFPNYIAGFADQPAGAVDGFSYDGPAGLWNGLTAAGHVLVALALLAAAGALISAVRSGQRASDDPWDGHTLEWAIPSPAPHDNFSELATVMSAEPVLDAKPKSEVSA